MGSVHQLRFIQKYACELTGPFLEVGSRNYGNTQNLRAFFADAGGGKQIAICNENASKCAVDKTDEATDEKADYVGVDMLAGPGVDIVADLSGEFQSIDRVLGGRRFGTIFCLSVLEHCAEPFAMAKNLVRLMRPGGKLCVSVPFAFRLHAYPDDYWRFTPSGIRKLFAEIEFLDKDAVWTTSRQGGRSDDFRPIDKELGKVSFSLSTHWRQRRRLRGLSAKMIGMLGRCGPLAWLSGYRYLLAPTDLMMIGTLH